MIASSRRTELNGILACLPDGHRSESHSQRSPAALLPVELRAHALTAPPTCDPGRQHTRSLR